MQPDEIVRCLGESPFFQALPQEERVALAHLGRPVGHGPDEVLFRPRQVPSALYLVVEGVVEVCRTEIDGGALEPVAYLGPGATLAESKVITGSPFRSLARFPEGGATVQWQRAAVLRRLYSSRDFSMQYLHNLARRLEGTFATLGGRRARLDGNLEHFDLPTILQTVAESGATGTLEIKDALGGKFGAIHVAERSVGPVACGTLTGAEALLEILVSPPEKGSFSFTASAVSLAGANRYELTHLLLESARMSDEMRRLQAEVPADRALSPTSGELTWTEGGDVEVLQRVWETLAAAPAGWGAVADHLPYSRGRVALAVRTLLEAGILRVADHPAADRPAPAR